MVATEVQAEVAEATLVVPLLEELVFQVKVTLEELVLMALAFAVVQAVVALALLE
jgi:hypothetical protein